MPVKDLLVIPIGLSHPRPSLWAVSTQHFFTAYLVFEPELLLQITLLCDLRSPNNQCWGLLLLWDVQAHMAKVSGVLSQLCGWQQSSMSSHMLLTAG